MVNHLPVFGDYDPERIKEVSNTVFDMLAEAEGLELLWETVRLAIAAIFVLAGTVKGLIGIGLPTVSVGIMSQFLPPHYAIAIVVIPMLVSNAWQVVRAGGWAATARRYWILVSLLVVSLWLTTFYTAQASAELLLAVIGLAVSVFAATSLARPLPALPDHLDRPVQVVAGLTAGVFGGLSSIWSPPSSCRSGRSDAMPPSITKCPIWMFCGCSSRASDWARRICRPFRLVF